MATWSRRSLPETANGCDPRGGASNILTSARARGDDAMRSTNVTRQPDDEDLPAPPYQWWSGGAAFPLGMLGFIGAIGGSLLGYLLASRTGMPFFTLVGLGVGLAVGLALGYRELRRQIGRGQRTSAEPLPPLRPDLG